MSIPAVGIACTKVLRWENHGTFEALKWLEGKVGMWRKVNNRTMDWEKWRSQWTDDAPDLLKKSYLEDIEHTVWKMSS